MPAVRGADERKFWQSLCKVFNNLIEETKKGKGVLTEDSGAWRTFMHSNPVSEFLNRMIGKMTHTLRMQSARSWREAATQGTNGRKINEMIRHEMQGDVGAAVASIINDNAAYIKTLPDLWARYASQCAYRMTMQGKRPEEVEAELRKVVPKHMQKNLKTIARTECAKANAAIVQARAEMCGIKAYIWRCVKDARSRDSHIHMDGVLVFYNDPPSPEALIGQKSYGNYHAGNTFNCRCYQEPVVDVDFLPDVISVYSQGRIVTMTKKQIKAIAKAA